MRILLLTLFALTAAADDRQRTIAVDGIGVAVNHRDAEDRAVANARVAAVRKAAATLLESRRRDGATRLLHALIGVDPAPFIVEQTKGQPHYDKATKRSRVRCEITIDERVLADRWCRLAAGLRLAAKRVHAIKLTVKVDGKHAGFVVSELTKALRSVKLEVGSAAALGDQPLSTAGLCQRARNARIDVVFRGTFTTGYDGGGKQMSHALSVDVVDVAKGAPVASVRDSGNQVLGGVTLPKASVSVVRNVLVPRALGELARGMLLATHEQAAFALTVEGLDEKSAATLRDWLLARADVCALTKPVLKDGVWRVGVLGIFRGKELTSALLARRGAPLALKAKSKSKTGAELVVATEKQKK